MLSHKDITRHPVVCSGGQSGVISQFLARQSAALALREQRKTQVSSSDEIQRVKFYLRVR